MTVLCYTKQSMQTYLDIVKQQSYFATMTSCNSCDTSGYPISIVHMETLTHPHTPTNHKTFKTEA